MPATQPERPARPRLRRLALWIPLLILLLGTAGSAGLALQWPRSLVEAHGGELTVESVPGGGTTFVVSLPAVAPVPATA
jgi:nitrogen-specific signal transduction histidine kinase